MKPVDVASALSPLRMLVKDICRDRPELTAPLSNDISVIERMVVTRGLPVLLEDLPALGKAFDKALSSGWLVEPAGAGTLRNKTMRFYCLMSECFATNGELYPDIDPNTVLYVRQLCYMYKKLKVTCPIENVRRTVEEFVSLDNSLRPPSPCWDDPVLFLHGRNGEYPSFGDTISSDMLGETSPCVDGLMVLFQKVSDMVVSTMPAPYWAELIPRHGPGAVSDLKTGSYKYDFPTWPDKLQAAFPYEHFCSPWGDLREADVVRPRSDVVPGRLLAVPKTYSKPRLITAEPTANQFCQQAVLKYLRDSFPKVLRRSVDFFSQDASRDAALEASKGIGIATVDLSSASDLLSCWTIERCFRKQPELLFLLASCRTSFITDGTKSDVFKYLKLRKFAGQGSAVTFPIQTIVYALAAITAVLADHYGVAKAASKTPTLKSVARAAGKVRVFGDDIIVPEGFTLWYLELILNRLQLKVNLTKTHGQGLFRESCGMDGYGGYEVTPVYLTSLTPGESADSLQSWVDVSNSFHRNGYWHLSSWMLGCLNEKISKNIPVSRKSDEYALALHTFSDGWYYPGKVVYSRYLHREEGKALVTISRAKRMQGSSDNALLQYFLESKSSGDTFTCPSFARWESGHIVRNTLTLKRVWVPLR